MIEIATKEVMKQTDPYVEQFERWIEPSAGQNPSWLFPLRKAGLASFAERGFPTLKDEDWRFTNVAPIASLPFAPVFEADGAEIPADALAQFPFAKLPGSRLVFVDGHYTPTLSALRG